MKTAEVEIASTEKFRRKLNREQRRMGVATTKGLSLRQLEEYLRLANEGGLAPEIQERFVSAEIRQRKDGDQQRERKPEWCSDDDNTDEQDARQLFRDPLRHEPTDTKAG